MAHFEEGEVPLSDGSFRSDTESGIFGGGTAVIRITHRHEIGLQATSLELVRGRGGEIAARIEREGFRIIIID